MSFISRMFLAFACFFRLLFEPRFARRIAALAAEASPARAPAGEEAEPSVAGNAASVPSRPSPSSAAPHNSSPAPSPVDESVRVSREQGALLVLEVLQREGRLIDFLQQDVLDYTDEQVGAAARVVHEGCRKALQSHLTIEPIRSEPEGAQVRAELGFDTQELKLTGQVAGAGPYEGTLRHRGWRVLQLSLPDLVGARNARVLAPAELEL